MAIASSDKIDFCFNFILNRVRVRFLSLPNYIYTDSSSHKLISIFVNGFVESFFSPFSHSLSISLSSVLFCCMIAFQLRIDWNRFSL